MKNNYLPRKTFYSVITLVVVVTMGVMSYIMGRVDSVSENFNHNFSEVTKSISSINTSIEYINEDIREIKADLKQ